MNKIFILPVLLLILMGCNKKEVVAPDFKVSTENDKTAFKVDEQINFNFSGNPNYITFYSGEDGRMYEFRERITAGARTDIGVPLQNMTTQLLTYSYSYAKAGTFKATFVVSNTNVYGSISDVKEIVLTIVP
ncbi:hypothetical protein ABIE26_001404 [Pedobacter africanus]|uniref:Uncharacterized protein n=1 Tax=Pedobacter africanus TaxID=151894 RepID=A0ACC6KSJ0_9SPHI|nr:DUF5017 domain-containing protein [Pedobacter africanus]MDR6782107.1 hypothetical protein [Pedobacter africanus]